MGVAMSKGREARRAAFWTAGLTAPGLSTELLERRKEERGGRRHACGGRQGLGSWAAHRARGAQVRARGVRTATAETHQPPEAQDLAARLAVMGDARARDGVAVSANA